MDAKELQLYIIEQVDKLNWDIDPKNLYAPIKYVLSLGGKRIRPLSALLACDLFSGDVQRALKPALALEVFHNFTLLHDDIMDRAEVRRGQPCVHVKWNDSAAILSGDAMLIKSYQLLEQCDPAILPQLLPLFSRTAAEVCEGQQYDMDFESRLDVSVAEYLEMIRLKTAVLLAAALKIGAICGGASDLDAQYLYEFGINIGIAFQLKDDLLDVYGDKKDFGKEIGGDICCNKKTFLLINAIQKAEGDDKKELNKWLSAKKFKKEEKVEAVKNIYDKLYLRSLTEQKMQEYYGYAIEALRRVNRSEEEKTKLYQLADKLLHRIS